MSTLFDRSLHFWVLLVVVLSAAGGCKHDPFLTGDDDPVTPVDTTGTPVDTSTAGGRPCNPDSVYFETQVLPILRSNCAISGCHDAASAQDGVVLTSYEKVISTGEVRPSKPSESKLYKVLVDDDPKDRMPQAPRSPLPNDQIQLIARWITQGAKNLSCDADAGGCKTTNISFANDLQPVLRTHCQGCHSGGAAPAGIMLTGYAGLKAAVATGRFFGAIAHLNGYTAMPLNGNKLSDCTVSQFKSWIDAGTPDN